MRIAAVAVVLLFAGCTRDNPNFCDPNKETCPDPPTCTESNATCVCLLPDGVCVQCTAEDERNCTDAKPACGDNNVCRGCRADDECSSSACLETGTCANPAEVVYAAATGVSVAGCGVQVGVNECSLAQAALEVQGPRNIIRLRPGTYGVSGLAGQIFPQATVLVARGSTINRAGGTGAILTVSGQALTLIGGTITGALGDDGIQCMNNGALRVHEALITDNAESGIEADSCELTVSRSTLTANRGGGIFMSGTGMPKPVNITNNFIHNNGQNGSPVGGMALLPAGASKLEFNTVVDNEAAQSAGVGGGIRCNTTGTYDFPNNLVYRNTGGIGNQVQVIGECTFTASFKLEDPTGTENIPMFVAPNATPPDYHLTAQSPPSIRDAVDCVGLVDFDGQTRPQNGKCDLGADELQRP